MQNIRLRTEIKQIIVEHSKKNKELLEATSVRDANNAFWMFIEENKNRKKEVDYKEVRSKWMRWFDNYIGRTYT